MGLEKNLKILKDAIDVMAQIKRPAEDTTHHDSSVKSSRRWQEPQKRKKKIEMKGLDSKTF